MDVTVLHFANLRLGTAFPTLGLRGRDQRLRLMATLAGLADLALAEQVGAVLISGDLFGCPVPAPATCRGVRAFIAKLRDSGIPVILIQGSRDPRSLYDPYLQPVGQDYLSAATILSADQPAVALETLNLVVQAVDIAGAERNAPFVPAPVPTGGRLIGMVYYAGEETPGLESIAARFSASPLCYLGVGGIISFATQQDGALIACSPGVPEPLEWGQEEGSVALVRINDEGVEVTRGRTGMTSLARRDLNLTLATARDVVSSIAAQAHDNLALEVVLRGQCPGDVLIDPATIEMELAQSFFNLRVADHTELIIDSEGPSDRPKGTVLGNFVRVMDERIRKASDDEQLMHEREAYRLGMGLLRGGPA
jgi:DNA repair protein SbcD/Mre11